ncbi:hypothetical protein ASF24_17575 [Methylobacterium sp. Leaf86]|nr:hypothetical protein ASF24_17575 [Methylobacterium sp. Leaf86]
MVQPQQRTIHDRFLEALPADDLARLALQLELQPIGPRKVLTSLHEPISRTAEGRSHVVCLPGPMALLNR